MQTFLPYQSFEQSAEVLDKKRCWKQVVEAKQILCVLRFEGCPDDWKQTKSYLKQGWKHHVAVRMWEGYEHVLAYYYNCMLDHCKKVHKINTDLPFLQYESAAYPWWMSNPNFYRAMRSRLIEKDQDFYLPKFPDDNGFNDGKYIWPVNESKTFRVI